MKANYGFADATGEYYITIDTDKCDGCGDCITACPENLFEVAADDYDKMVAMIREEVRTKLGYLCPGYEAACRRKEVNCHTACQQDAINHSW